MTQTTSGPCHNMKSGTRGARRKGSPREGIGDGATTVRCGSGGWGSTVMAPKATPSLDSALRHVHEEREAVRWVGTGERWRPKQRTVAA
jgi:hypothetical protein